MLDFTRCTELKEKMTSYRPLAVHLLKEIEKRNLERQIYTSNALEGNTLTLSETSLILQKGMTIGGKSMIEHLEVINLNLAVDYVMGLISGEEKLTEQTIKEIHRLVLDRTSKENIRVGQYRNIDVEIQESAHIPPPHYLVKEQMDAFFQWIQDNEKKLHPVEYAATLHEKFVTIHPFGDGNGRTARLLMNFALLQAGYLDIFIKPDPNSRKQYNDLLEYAQINKDLEPFIALVKDRVEASLEERIVLLEKAEESHQVSLNFENEIKQKFKKDYAEFNALESEVLGDEAIRQLSLRDSILRVLFSKLKPNQLGKEREEIFYREIERLLESTNAIDVTGKFGIQQFYTLHENEIQNKLTRIPKIIGSKQTKEQMILAASRIILNEIKKELHCGVFHFPIVID